MSKLLTCLRNEDGATAIEYGLIVGIMAIIIIAAFAVFGPAVQATFTTSPAAM